MRILSVSVSILAVLALAAAAQADVIQVIPVTGGMFGAMNLLNGDGSFNTAALYHNVGNMLNNQPTGFDPVTGVPTGAPLVGYGDTLSSGYPGGWGFIDFGEDWADVRITAAWTLSRGWAHGPATPYQQLWWENDDTNDWIHQSGLPLIPGAPNQYSKYLAIPADAVQETTLNFNTQASNTDPSGGAFTWFQDLNLAPGAAIAPQGRYLVMQAANPMTAMQEIVIGGYIVPEPATMSLLLVGGLIALRRRTR